MKKIEYPGYVVKIKWYERLYNWYLNKFIYKPFIYKETLKLVRADQEVVDELYNMAIAKEFSLRCPPVFMNRYVGRNIDSIHRKSKAQIIVDRIKR